MDVERFAAARARGSQVHARAREDAARSLNTAGAGRCVGMVRMSLERLDRTVREVLKKGGVPERHAAIQADLLLAAELAARPSHGLLRLPRIIERIANGVCDPVTTGRRTWTRESFLDVDGEMGLGPVVATAAIDALCERAAAVGIAVAAIRNNNHIGMLSWYLERIVREGKVGLIFSTSEALVHPYGGREALVGTNPIAIGVPARPEPLILDMATSRVSMGQIHDYANRNQPIPAGWALDGAGDPTTDANAAKSGAIAPFGGSKGYGLALAIEALVSVLSGAAIGRDVAGTLDSTEVCNKGDLFLVMDPHAGLSVNAVEAVSGYLDAVRRSVPIDPPVPVMVPGDRARKSRKASAADGIDVDPQLLARLKRLAEIVPSTKADQA